MRHSPEEALRACVDALGGLQRVGHQLRPEIDPVLAGQWLSHCLDDDRREKLSLSQIILVLRQAKAAGKHAGAELLNELIGYRVSAVLDEREQIADIAREAQAAAALATELSVEMLARADALHLKVMG